MSAITDGAITVAVGSAAVALGSVPRQLLKGEVLSSGCRYLIEEGENIEKVASSVAKLVAQAPLGKSSTVATVLLAETRFSGTVLQVVSRSARFVAKRVLVTFEPWKNVAGRAGYFILSPEFAFAFISHLNENRGMTDDILWATVRGGVSGAVTGALLGGERWKEQMLLGAITGCGYGAASSSFGVIAGKTAKFALIIFGYQPSEDRKWRQLGERALIALLPTSIKLPVKNFFELQVS